MVFTSTMAVLKPPYPAIKEGLLAGRVIPFLGAGASLGERDAPWSKDAARFLPTAGDLPDPTWNPGALASVDPRARRPTVVAIPDEGVEGDARE